MKKNHLTRNKLRKGIKKYTFFAIIVIIYILFNTNVRANSFKFSEFNWDTFYESKKEFWTEGCITNNEMDQECEYKVLTSQKEFYTKFYKMLTKMEKENIIEPNTNTYNYIDDIVLETVFYELSPSQFSDDSKEYANVYTSESNKGLYNINTNNPDPEIKIDYNNDDIVNYFSKETDTVETLVQNLIAYTTKCYGVIGNPVEKKTSDGTTYTTCDNGDKVNLQKKGMKCVEAVGPENELGFYKYFISKLQHDENLKWYEENLVVSFLGRNFNDENYNTCKSYNSSYKEGTIYIYNDTPKISTNRYFDFLVDNKYFDAKPHLQYKFKESILNPAGVDCMTSDICENSLEKAELYDAYEGQAREVRLQIVEDIISILNNYGYEIEYDPLAVFQYNEYDEATATRKSFYWPIGSDETEEKNGVIYAVGDPVSKEILYGFGPRENPISKEIDQHYGIDIKGIDESTNVISVYHGEVISVVNSCTIGDYMCNDGYGNAVIISHPNNDYTIYAHLSNIDSSITIGTTVDKGQVLGHTGKTGMTIENVLHFELRKGGNDVTYAVNPLDYMDAENPRPKLPEGDFSVHETSLTKEEFSSRLRSYCVSNKCSQTFMNVFVANAEHIYDVSISSNVNPELVVIRGAKEGMSPGGSTNNYWGIACYNGKGASACRSYSSLDDGIKGFSVVVKDYNTVVEMMSKYAYIGAVWYNPGSWSLGGCKYYPYISKYMSDIRKEQVSTICSSSECSSTSDSRCTKTNDEDQNAYASYNASAMVNMRYVAFGI